MNTIFEQPTGKEYKPFVNSGKWTKGRITKIYSSKTNREHIFLSKLSADVFFYFEHSEHVSDIRESFPMTNLEKALTSDEKNLLKNYFNKETGKPHILNTTFLLTKDDGQLIARAVKYSYDLKSESTIRHLHLQQRFWKDYHGIDFMILTEKQVNSTVVKNLELIRTSVDTTMCENMLEKVRLVILGCESNDTFQSLFERESINVIQGMTAFRQLLYFHKIKCDLKISIKTNTIIKNILRF